MIDQINNLENKVNNLYINNNLKPSILNEFNILENNIRNEYLKDKNNPIFNTYFKNLDLFKERTILKLEKINLENQLINKSKISVKTESSIQSSIKSSDISQQTITSSSEKSTSYTKYLIYLLIIIIVIIIIYFVAKKFL
jgi:hypothetical protein